MHRAISIRMGDRLYGVVGAGMLGSVILAASALAIPGAIICVKLLM